MYYKVSFYHFINYPLSIFFAIILLSYTMKHQEIMYLLLHVIKNITLKKKYLRQIKKNVLYIFLNAKLEIKCKQNSLKKIPE